MKRGMTVLVCLGVVWAAAAPAWSGEGVAVEPEGPKDKPRRKERGRGKDKAKLPAKGDPFGEAEPMGGKKGRRGEKAGATFGDDLDALKGQLSLSDEQMDKLGKIKAERDKTLARWDQVNQPKIERAETRLSQLAGKDKRDRRVGNARKQLEAGLKSLRAGRTRIEAGYERRMFAVLTPEQRGTWNGPLLTEEMTKEFSLVFLEGAQEEKIATLCNAQAKRLAVPVHPEQQANLLRSLKAQVYRSVLNSKQKAEYAKMKRAEAARKSSKGGERRKR
jgi:Spy/CpxP family protein refolding chaperone